MWDLLRGAFGGGAAWDLGRVALALVVLWVLRRVGVGRLLRRLWER